MKGRLRKMGLRRRGEAEDSRPAADSPDPPKKKKKKKKVAAAKKAPPAPPASPSAIGGGSEGWQDGDRPPEHESTGPKALREIADEDLEKLLEAHR